MSRTEGTSELDESGFRKYPGKFIFIASSGDVHDERQVAEAAIRDTLRDLSRPDVTFYSWDLQTVDDPFDQRLTMQRNIPRPSHENCLGIVYIVGERIGLPLESTFDPKFLGTCEDWIGDDHHPLELRWPENPEEARARLEAGAYPLTGGVFEFLAALSHRDDDHPNGKPLWLCLLADREVPLAGEDIPLNHSRWHTRCTADKTLSDKRAWEDTHYFGQVKAVHNFMRACAARGIAQNPTPNHDKLRKDVCDFVRRRIFGVKGDITNPYRELRYYDIQHTHFHGREDFVATVVDRLEAQFAAKDGPTAFRLTGYSGSGKSSALRAGILRKLAAPSERGRYSVVVLHPQEHFKTVAASDVDRPLDAVLFEMEMQGRLQLDRGVWRELNRGGAAAPEEAARQVSAALQKMRADGAQRLILALDQFEEIVDELGTARRREYWQPLLRFIEKLTENPNVGLIYTLERNRKAQHDRVGLPSPFNRAREQELDDATDAHIRRIIFRPFADTKYPLAEEVIDELAANFKALREENLRSARNSVLPLLALKLYQLWKFVNANFEQQDGGIVSSAVFGGNAGRIGGAS